jgi:hypothetical protein
MSKSDVPASRFGAEPRPHEIHVFRFELFLPGLDETPAVIANQINSRSVPSVAAS